MEVGRRAGLLQPRQVTVLSLFFVAAVAVTAVTAHLLGRWTRIYIYIYIYITLQSMDDQKIECVLKTNRTELLPSNLEGKCYVLHWLRKGGHWVCRSYST